MEQNNIESDTNYTWGFVLLENNELFGSGSINYNEKQKLFELGYNIMKKYWNRGLTTEASKAMIRFAAQKLEIRSFFSGHAKDNPASGRVLEKLGFIYQKDSEYSSFDGRRSFESKEYILQITPES